MLLIRCPDELMKAENPANAMKGNAKRVAVLDKGGNQEDYSGVYTPKVTFSFSLATLNFNLFLRLLPRQMTFER